MNIKALFRPFLCAAVALAALGAQADEPAAAYPTRPVKLVVPFTPGGGSDALARILASKLGETLKQSVIVENRPGAGGNLAANYVAASAPDGCTLLLVDTPFVANLSVYPKAGYSLADFEPVAMVATVPSFIVVGKHLPVNSVKELIALAKKEPGKLNMASGGAGGAAHLAAARFALETGVEWAHVPYRGMSPALMDVVGGQADVIFVTAPTVLPHLKGGRVKALAVTSAVRTPLAPEVPSVAELGLPMLVSDNWYGIVAPAKTDPKIVEKLFLRINEALRDPAIKTKMLDQLATPAPMPSAQAFGQLLQRDKGVWAATVKAAHITVN